MNETKNVLEASLDKLIVVNPDNPDLFELKPPKGVDIQASQLEEAVNKAIASTAFSLDHPDASKVIARIIPPIQTAIPYVELYSRFFQEARYDYTEDNLVAVEEVFALAWQTDRSAQVMYTEPSFAYHRPEFVTFQTGINIRWDVQVRATWNILQRAMQRATEELARLRDSKAKAVIDAAISSLSGHTTNVSSSMTKSAVDSVIKYQAGIGFPVTDALINPSRLADMADWSHQLPNVPERFANDIIVRLYAEYGGVRWWTSVYADTDTVYFFGGRNTIGYHQIRGNMRTARDTDIDRGLDRYAIRDAEHAWIVLNPYALHKLVIT